MITPIIETVMFCGRQELALRGHDDAGVIESLTMQSHNDGNFRALLRYRASGGDDNLRRHLVSDSQRNASYLSPKIQNEIISSLNNLILGKLVSRVNSAECFSVLADETTDISGVEQLSLGVRYLDAVAGQVREDFLQFVPVYDVTGKALSTVILDSLSKFGVRIDKMRGQGYDGAASMSGHISGVQTHVRQRCPLPVDVHCSSHSLNLAVSNACDVAAVRNCMGTIGAVHTFLNTPKRNTLLKQCVESLLPTSSHHRLKQMCPTRWVERHDSVHIFKQLMPAVHDCLAKIAEWPDSESAARANQLLCSIRQAEFIVALCVTARVFAVTLPLCRELQRETLDLAAALEMAAEVKTVIGDMRARSEEEFKVIFDTAGAFCADSGVEIAVPRLAKRLTKRCNVTADSPEAYYRAAVLFLFWTTF